MHLTGMIYYTSIYISYLLRDFLNKNKILISVKHIVSSIFDMSGSIQESSRLLYFKTSISQKSLHRQNYFILDFRRENNLIFIYWNISRSTSPCHY